MKRRKQRIKVNKLIGLLFFSLLLIFGVCFFLKSDFFYLNELVINNNKYLNKEEIKNLINIEDNKNIFFYDLDKLEKNIKSNPYVKNCEIKRKIPNKLIINIKEKNIIGPLYNGSNYCYIDDKGNFIDEIKEVKKNSIIIYIDYSLNNNLLNLKNAEYKDKLISLYSELEKENILRQLKFINFKDKSIIQMKTKTNLTICFNKDDNIKKDVLKLNQVLVDLQNRKQVYGKIDMTYNDYILYDPYYR